MKSKYNRLPEKEQSEIVYFNPKTSKQKELIDLIKNNEIVIAKGVAGSGKSFVALATALSLLGDTYKKIILVKSETSIPGEEIGFIQGSIHEKMTPVIMSYTWNIDKILRKKGAAEELIRKNLIEVIPLAFFRGLSIDSAIVIIDESQNISFDIFKTIITRIGEDCKYIFLGDTEQVDMKKKDKSCLQTVINIFKDTELIKTLEFGDDDCVRNPKIPKVLEILRENNL